MKLRIMALALATAAAGLAGGQAFAQDRDVTITHTRPDGAVVTRHIRADEDNPDGPVVHRTVRVERPDGTTVIRRTTRWTDRDEFIRPHRTVVIHRRYDPMHHVVVRTVRHRPAYVVNRHVTVIRDIG